MKFVMGFLGKLCTVLFVFLAIAGLKVQVKTEKPLFNETHRLNSSGIEVTTDILTPKNHSEGLKQKTATHFLSTTIDSKVVLIPPAKIASQIVRKKNVHKS